jgi:hypothetical protein
MMGLSRNIATRDSQVTVKDTMQSRNRIGSWTEFVKDHWENKTPAVQNEIIKKASDENAALFKAWKQKAAFSGISEDLNKYETL